MIYSEYQHLLCEERIMKIILKNNLLTVQDKMYITSEDLSDIDAQCMEDWEDTFHQAALEDFLVEVFMYILDLDYNQDDEDRNFQSFSLKTNFYNRFTYQAQYEVHAKNIKTNNTVKLFILCIELNKIYVYKKQ